MMNKISKSSKNCQKSKNRKKFQRNVHRIVNEERQKMSKLLRNIEETNSKVINSQSIEQLTTQLSSNTDHGGTPTLNQCSNKLRSWVIRHNVTRRTVNDLLIILSEFGLNWLPKDSRSLCKTPKVVKIISTSNGKYWYHGIETNIRHIFSNLIENITLKLDFNIDGVPLFKSSGTEFWPILGRIYSKSEFIPKFLFLTLNFIEYDIFTDFPKISPFTISVWCGAKKPKPVNEYLAPFVEELNSLIEHGIDVNNHHICIKVRCFICDTPARCLLKGIMN